MKTKTRKAKLIEEIMNVRESGIANMCYCGEVYEVAKAFRLTTLVEFLEQSEENRIKYFNFIVRDEDIEI